MGWFEEQLEERKQKDNELFENAFQELSSVVMPSAGKRRWKMISKHRKMPSRRFYTIFV